MTITASQVSTKQITPVPWSRRASLSGHGTTGLHPNNPLYYHLPIATVTTLPARRNYVGLRA